MPLERGGLGWRFWGTWVGATTAGWVVGLVTAFVVAHVVNVVYPKETNLVVGACLGAVVGFAQRRYGRNPITADKWWVVSTSIGMGIPFVLVEAANALWGHIPGLGPGVLPGVALTVTAGGLLTGFLQLRVVGRHSNHPGIWIPATIAAWGLGWLAMDLIPGVGLLVGGAINGALTGGAMVWMCRGSRPAK